MILRAGVERIRSKSLAQTAALRELAEERLGRYGVGCVTPREDHRRGGHLSLTHRAAGKLSRTLRNRGVIPDFRPPDILRLAPSPLATRFAECETAVGILEDILANATHEQRVEPDAPVT